jgi:hypothetical protein
VTAKQPGAGVARKSAPRARTAVPAPVPEPKPESVIVVGQDGIARSFDADDWSGESGGGIEVTKDGKRVATFPPGYVGVYRKSARRTDLPGLPGLVTRW